MCGQVELTVRHLQQRNGRIRTSHSHTSSQTNPLSRPAESRPLPAGPQAVVYKYTYHWFTLTLPRSLTLSGLWCWQRLLYCCSCLALASMQCPADSGNTRDPLVVCPSQATWPCARVWATTACGFPTCWDMNLQLKRCSRAPAGCHSSPESATRTPASSCARSSLLCALRGKISLKQTDSQGSVVACV